MRSAKVGPSTSSSTSALTFPWPEPLEGWPELVPSVADPSTLLGVDPEPAERVEGSASSMPWMAAMLGWLRLARICASLVNRASRSGSAAKASGRVFRATWRLSWVSVACQTWPYSSADLDLATDGMKNIVMRRAVGMWNAKRSKPLVGIRVLGGFPQGWHFHSAPWVQEGRTKREHAPSPLRINLANRSNGLEWTFERRRRALVRHRILRCRPSVTLRTLL